METSIRTFGRGDIEFALAQTSREGWDTAAELFETALAHDPDGAFVIEAEGGRAGMVTTTAYRRSGWIGNLIVPPDCRRQGIGQRLMTHAMAHLSRRGLRTMRLEADPPGIGIYRRLGFVDEFESLRFRLTTRRESRPAAAERITHADLPTIAAFDARHFGAERGRLLTLLFRHAKAAYRLRGQRGVRGYAFATPSPDGVRLGPFVAEDSQAAESLLESILADSRLTTIAVGVPGANDAAIELLDGHGFQRTPSSFRMVFGERVAAGRPDNVFAIANGAMG